MPSRMSFKRMQIRAQLTSIFKLSTLHTYPVKPSHHSVHCRSFRPQSALYPVTLDGLNTEALSFQLMTTAFADACQFRHIGDPVRMASGDVFELHFKEVLCFAPLSLSCIRTCQIICCHGHADVCLAQRPYDNWQDLF